MKRRVCATHVDRACLARGSIEKHGGCDDPSPKSIEATTVEVVSLAEGIGSLSEGGILPDTGGLVGEDRRPPNFLIEQSTDSERLISNHP